MSINGEIVNRFTSPINIFIVITAYSLTVLLVEFIQEINWQIIFTYLAIIENSAVLAGTLLIANQFNAHSTKRAGMLTIAILMVALALTFLWRLLLSNKAITSLSKQLTEFSIKNYHDQLIILKIKIKTWLPDISLGIFSYIIAAISMLVMNNGFTVSPNVDVTYNIFAYTFANRELLIVFTAILIFSTVKFLQAIIKHYWTSIMIVIAINAAFVVANREKLQHVMNQFSLLILQ